MHIRRTRKPLRLTAAEQRFILLHWSRMTAWQIATALNQAKAVGEKPMTNTTTYAFVRRIKRTVYAEVAALFTAAQGAKAIALRQRLKEALPNKQVGIRQAMREFYIQNNPLQENPHG